MRRSAVYLYMLSAIYLSNGSRTSLFPVDASSAGLFEDERRRRMHSVNPVYIPRNWMLQEAITDAEKDDFTKVST